MKIQVLFLTKLSSWKSDRNHIIVRYSRQEILSEQLTYISIKNRYKLCKLLKLNFWQSIKFITNHYSKKPIYKHYTILWESDDITEVIPFLEILYKQPEIYDFSDNTSEKETIVDILAKFL